MDAIERPRWASVAFAILWPGPDDVSQYVYAGGFRTALVLVTFQRVRYGGHANLLILVLCQCFCQYLFHL